ALVIGATGGIGGAATRVLLARGWRVKALNRAPDKAARAVRLPGIEWISGDAMRADDVVRAAQGCSLIVHGANPPGYRDWDRLILPMME
ncbi:NAD(P)H-binding protein, partial [Acinetobacter baumannii]